MSKLLSSAKKSYEFMSVHLWRVRMNRMNKKQGFFVRIARVFSLAVKGFIEDNNFVTATALTFYTLFSIVPIFALVFAIAKGFGYDKSLQDSILHSYPQYGTVLSNTFHYANIMLDSAKGGVIAGFGIVLLLWSVMRLLLSIENSFNEVWEVKIGRGWVRKLTDYLTITLIAPIFLIVSGGVEVALQTGIESIKFLGEAGALLVKLIPLALISLLFTFLYVALPNTKVKFKSAFTAAIIATLLFQSLGWAYVKFQIGANRMNAIYGGFAALPLFLIWVQYSWYIVLFGAQLAYSFQHVDHFELRDEIQNLSVRYRKVLTLVIASLVARRFDRQEKSLNVDEITLQLDLPSRLTRTIVNELVETGVLSEVRTEKSDIVYQPAMPESKMTVKAVIDAIEKKGVNELPINDSNEMATISQLMKDIDLSLDTQLGNIPVKDIIK